MSAARSALFPVSLLAMFAASSAFASTAPAPDRPVSDPAANPMPAAPAAQQHPLRAQIFPRELQFHPTITGMSIGLNAINIPWGQTVTIPTSEATSKSNGLCTFRAQYWVRNFGLLTSIATQNTIRLNTQGGALLSTVAMGPIASLGSFNTSSDIVLAPGTWILYAKIDEPNTNLESNETNNLNRVRVIISGSCN